MRRISTQSRRKPHGRDAAEQHENQQAQGPAAVQIVVYVGLDVVARTFSPTVT